MYFCLYVFHKYLLITGMNVKNAVNETPTSSILLLEKKHMVWENQNPNREFPGFYYNDNATKTTVRPRTLRPLRMKGTEEPLQNAKKVTTTRKRRTVLPSRPPLYPLRPRPTSASTETPVSASSDSIWEDLQASGTSPRDPKQKSTAYSTREKISWLVKYAFQCSNIYN
jgi:hypothetical protein